MVTQIEALKSSVDYLDSNNFIFHHDTAATSILVMEDVAIVPPPPSSDFFSDAFHDIILHASHLVFFTYNYVILVLYDLDSYVVIC